jgi:hypothetical protein
MILSMEYGQMNLGPRLRSAIHISNHKDLIMEMLQYWHFRNKPHGDELGKEIVLVVLVVLFSLRM